MATLLASVIDEPGLGRAYSHDSEDDYDEVHQLVDHAVKATQRTNFRSALRKCVEQRARLKWPAPSPEVQARIAADRRDREVLMASEERWAEQTSAGPGKVRRYRKEQAARTRETMQRQMQASVAQAQAKSRKRGG